MLKRSILILPIFFVTFNSKADCGMAHNKEGFCHDTQTGEYRPIKENDNPVPMEPHSDHHEEFKAKHLKCNPE